MEEQKMNAVVASYEKYQEDRRLDADNSRRLEYQTGIAYMDKFIKPADTILDVAAGPGAYALRFAAQGYKVTALDITPRYIDMLKTKAKESGLKIPAYVNDARDLSQFEDESFDIVLCMGPIYHLTEAEDRARVIRECRRVLKTGGLMYVAYINKYYVFSHLALSSRQYRQERFFQKIINEQVMRSDDEDCFWTDAWFTTPSEIESLCESFNLEKVCHVAQDGIGRMDPDEIDNMRPEEFEQWKQFHLRTCEEPSILGISNHGLFIGRKSA